MIRGLSLTKDEVQESKLRSFLNFLPNVDQKDILSFVESCYLWGVGIGMFLTGNVLFFAVNIFDLMVH